MSEYIDVSFVYGNVDVELGENYRLTWNKMDKITRRNLQEVVDFSSNHLVDYSLSVGLELDLNFTTWCYRPIDNDLLRNLNKNIRRDLNATISKNHVRDFLKMAAASESPSDCYYDKTICTAWAYDEEEDEWYIDDDIQCYCDKCLDRMQRDEEWYQEYMRDSGEF